MNRKNLHFIFNKIFLVIIVFTVSIPAFATSIHGRVTFTGTISEYRDKNGYQAVFRIRLADSTCTASSDKGERWVVVRSGLVTPPYQHNEANFRNAYNTVMAAFLSGKNVQIDGLFKCDKTATQTINLWSSSIGMY